MTQTRCHFHLGKLIVSLGKIESITWSGFFFILCFFFVCVFFFPVKSFAVLVLYRVSLRAETLEANG